MVAVEAIGFPIITGLAIFDLQVAWLLSTKFPVNWPRGSGDTVQIRFLRRSSVAAIIDFRSEQF